jgi:Domain of unknown function (DUF4279)
VFVASQRQRFEQTIAAKRKDTRMSEYEFTITLCIRHPNIEPARITAALGIDPQATWKEGDPRIGLEGELLQGIYRETYWSGRLMHAPQLSAEWSTVERVLLQILAQLRRSFEFLRDLRSEGAASELHVSIFSRQEFRLDFSPETLELLGRLGLALALEVHPPQPDAGSRPSSS